MLFCLSFQKIKTALSFLDLSYWPFSLYFIYLLSDLSYFFPTTNFWLMFVLLFLVPWGVKLGCLRSFFFLNVGIYCNFYFWKGPYRSRCQLFFIGHLPLDHPVMGSSWTWNETNLNFDYLLNIRMSSLILKWDFLLNFYSLVYALRLPIIK